MKNKQLTLNCNGQLLNLTTPQVMGVINATPDSFYSASRSMDVDSALAQAQQMINDGAHMLDIGGMSSRPGAELISVEEELQRVIPIIKNIHQQWPEVIISIDTVRGEVAQKAVAAGASIVNDISAGKFDTNMYPIVAELGVPYILMHMQGQPKDMQVAPQYDNVVQDVLDFLIFEIEKLEELGIKDIIIDPGFGFGKHIQHNYQLLQKMHVFEILEYPVLAGISRKSMIWKLLNSTPENVLEATTALHMVALQQGANILRVHDVRQAKEVITLFSMLES